MKATSAIATRLSDEDSSAGSAEFAVCSSLPASSPPIAGPHMKPTPIAAPTVPSAFARFSRVLMSDPYANAAEMMPAMNPASMRDTSNHQSAQAKPSIAYDTHAPDRLVMRMGRRPHRSLSRPQNG